MFPGAAEGDEEDLVGDEVKRVESCEWSTDQEGNVDGEAGGRLRPESLQHMTRWAPWSLDKEETVHTYDEDL